MILERGFSYERPSGEQAFRMRTSQGWQDKERDGRDDLVVLPYPSNVGSAWGVETHSWRIEYLADPVHHVLDRVDHELRLLSLSVVASVIWRRRHESRPSPPADGRSGCCGRCL